MEEVSGEPLWGRWECGELPEVAYGDGGSPPKADRLHIEGNVKVRARRGERPRPIMTSLSDVASGAASHNVEPFSYAQDKIPEFPKAGEGSQ